MKDIVELHESAIEDWAMENVRGEDFRCACGEWCPLSDGDTISPNPWAKPICPKCLDEYFMKKGR